MVEYRGNGARRRSSPEAGKKVLLAAFLQEIEGGDALRGEYRRSRHRGYGFIGGKGGENKQAQAFTAINGEWFY